MALLDRVIFNPSRDGPGDFVVVSAVKGYQTPSQANAVDGSTYSYAAEVRNGASAITEWEVGQGTWTAVTSTLARTTVLFSSNSGSKVNFSSVPQVMITMLAEDFAASGITINTSTITGGTDTSILFDKAGIVGEDSSHFVWSYGGISGAWQGTIPGLAISNSGGNNSAFFIASSPNSLGSFPSPILYPVINNKVLAFDLSPHGSPTDTGYGLAWMDICSSDQITSGNLATSCLHLASKANGQIIASAEYTSGTVQDLKFGFQQDAAFTQYAVLHSAIGVGGATANAIFGIGSGTPYNFGGLLNVQFNSSYSGEVAGFSIDTGTDAQPELLFGCDVTKNIAYIQAASRDTAFSALVLNPNNTPIAIGSNAGVIDTGISRNSAGQVFFGNGTQGSFSSLIGARAMHLTSSLNEQSFLVDNNTFPTNFNIRGTTDGTQIAAAAYTKLSTGAQWVESLRDDLSFLFYFFDGVSTFANSMKLTKLGSIICNSGGAIASNATDGFLYIPTCAGTPTGTPTAQTGNVAIVWDTTNHKFWVYDGAWKGGTNPGVWT